MALLYPDESQTYGPMLRKGKQCVMTCLGAGGISSDGGGDIPNPDWVVHPENGTPKLPPFSHERWCHQSRAPPFLTLGACLVLYKAIVAGTDPGSLGKKEVGTIQVYT